jgi:hypothetical protein
LGALPSLVGPTGNDRSPPDAVVGHDQGLRHKPPHYERHRALDVLDRAFAETEVRLHLFGLKSQAVAYARDHPRVASCGSQAYGVQARQDACKARMSKSDQIIARAMTRWYHHQINILNGPAIAKRHVTLTSNQATDTPIPPSNIEARIAAAAEDLRTLHANGEIEWTDLTPQAAYEFAFMDDD